MHLKAPHPVVQCLGRRFQLVAGVRSSHPHKAREQGVAIGLAPDRAYASLDEMIAAEAGTAIAPPWFPGVEDGLHGVRFVEAAVQSNQHAGAWTPCLE